MILSLKLGKLSLSILATGSNPVRLTVVDEIRNFCVTSQLVELKQLEEVLALAS